MEIYHLAIILCAPVAGWVIASVFPMSRETATLEERKHDTLRNLVPLVIWLPLGFALPNGPMRWTSLSATVLLYLAVYIVARRAVPEEQ